jgi:hypothetical protein
MEYELGASEFVVTLATPLLSSVVAEPTGVPFALKLTVPVGTMDPALWTTVAFNVTVAPLPAWLGVTVRLVVEVPCDTVTLTAADVEPVKLLLPA